jgi:putative ABC transport system permease protein
VCEPFARRRLEQARAVAGVESAYPLYIEFRYSLWKNHARAKPDEPSIRPIRVLAFDPAAPAFRPPEIRQQSAHLLMLDTVLMDARSRPFYRRDPDLPHELSERSIRVVGNFHLGTDFLTDGNLIMSDRNYARFFPSRDPSRSPLAKVEIGLIKLTHGADRSRMKEALQAALPRDVTVMTREELAWREKAFWQKSTPVGFVFGLGLVMGFVGGVMICYQILAADVADHRAEYATLMAIGHPDRYLTGVMLHQALLLSALGFLPGVLLSWLLYGLLASMTGLPLRMTLFWAAVVGLLTVAMCIVSALRVIRKIQQADPAEVFA